MRSYIYEKCFISQIENIVVNVLACISFTKSYNLQIDGWAPIHPWTTTKIRSGIKLGQ